MDKMAYLQQIAGDDNSVNHKASKSDNFLAKFFNIWTLVGVVGLLVLIIWGSMIINAFNKVDTKDRDLLVQSYWQANYLSQQTIQKYARELKNSDVRNMTASLNSTLNEILVNGKNLLESEYGVKSGGSEKDAIAATEKTTNDELNARLEDGRLSGLLDRTFLREITMQIAYLRSYQSGVAERAKKAKVRQFSQKVTENLDNIYKQFHDFKSPTM